MTKIREEQLSFEFEVEIFEIPVLETVLLKSEKNTSSQLDNQPNFSIEHLFDSFTRKDKTSPENGSSQGIYPREKINKKGLNLDSNGKDRDINQYIQELITILNTVFKYQEEKMAAESKNHVSDTNNVVIGSTGISEWILMSKVSKVESKVIKDFLKEQKTLKPYNFYKLCDVFESYLTEISSKLRKKPYDISNHEFYQDLELIQKFVTSNFLEKKFNEFFRIIFTDQRVEFKHQPTKTQKMNNPDINRYLADLKLSNVSLGRYKKMKTDSKRFATWMCNYKEFQKYDIHTLPFWLIRREHLIDYKNYLLKRAQQDQFSLNGCKQHFKNIKTLFKRLYQLDLLVGNISENISNISADDYFYRDLPNDEEIFDLFKIIRVYSDEPLDDMLAFALMAFMGFRCCELVMLKWENINLDIETLTMKSKGRNKYHILPIPEIVASLFKQYPEILKNGYVFKSKTKSREHVQMDIFKKFVLFKDMAGWDYQSGVHILRHWFITKLASLNIDLGDLRTLARHDALETSSKYIHFKDNELKEDVNKIFDGGIDNGAAYG